jgi:hypothetical protein
LLNRSRIGWGSSRAEPAVERVAPRAFRRGLHGLLQSRAARAALVR